MKAGPLPIQPVASVLVVTYNHEAHIAECLESLANQRTKFPFEILVGEDCSTDETRRKVVEMAAKYPERIRPILNERNLGAHGNFAKLRALAKGQYVAFCEGEDYWHRSDKLQRQVELLQARPDVSMVCTDADALITGSGRRIRSVHERIGQWARCPDDMTAALLLRRINIFTCTACLPRKVFEDMHENNPYEFSEVWPMGDLQMWLEASRMGKIVPIRESMATYRVVAGTSSRPQDPERRFAITLKSLELLESYVRRFGCGEVVLQGVRMNHLMELFVLASTQADGQMRERVRGVADKMGIRATKAIDCLALWALRGERRFRWLAPQFSRWSKLMSVPRRVAARATRLRHSKGSGESCG